MPCANADCIGEHGKWNTKPLGYHTRRAPCILIGPDGMPSPMVAMRSRCLKCKTNFSHLDTVVLRRLMVVPELVGSKWLPFDPEYSFTDIFIGRTLTSSLELDVISRQGADTLIKKVVKLGAETVQGRVEAYMAAGQLWLGQMELLVGDGVWTSLPATLQLQLADLRGELIYFLNTQDALAPLGEGCGRRELARWNIPKLSRSRSWCPRSRRSTIALAPALAPAAAPSYPSYPSCPSYPSSSCHLRSPRLSLTVAGKR